jgi:PAS domain S-box-containing protein
MVNSVDNLSRAAMIHMPTGLTRRAVVLSVDDSEASRYRRRRALTHAGFSVVDAATGSDALKAAFASPPDVALLDVNLPDMDGVEVCRSIRNDPRTARTLVLMISAFPSDAELRTRALKSGASVYLSDPLGDAELVAWIEALVRLRTAEEAHERAEEELRQKSIEAEARAEELAGLMDALPVVTFVAHDRECRRMTSSRAAHELLRIPPESNTSLSAPDEERPATFRVTAAGRELATEELPVQRAALTGEAVSDAELRVEFDGGGYRDLLGNATPLFDSRGNVRGALGAFLDITERKKIESELRMSEQRFRLAIESSPIAVYMHDLELRYTWAADSPSRTPESIVGKRDSDLMPSAAAAALMEFKRRVLESGRKDRAQLVVPDHGEERILDVHAEPTFDGRGRLSGLLVATSDVTELVRAKATAEAANRAKDALLATVSHELRTPMTVILGWAQIINETADQREVLEASASIEAAARAQSRVVSDLLDLAHIAAGKLALSTAPVELDSVVRESATMLQPSAAEKNISLECVTEPVVISADRQRLQQVIWNLVSNSVKFTPPGGSVSVTAGPAGVAAEIVVSDTGDGIAPEFLPYVFGAFTQERPFTRERHGLGLGLAIAKSLVEAHGGEIAVQSGGVGRGSRFTVRLPRA